MRHPTRQRQRPARSAFIAIALAAATVATGTATLASPAQAQPALRNPARNLQGADSLLTHALARVAEGDTTQALEMLERANKIAPKDPDILYWRAVILNRTTFLRVADLPRNILAWRLLEKAESEDRRNARYAIEMGRIRLMSPLMRIEAERQFRRALSIADKSGDRMQYAEAAYEIGLVKQRRYLTGKDRYMITSPGLMFDPITATSRLHYVREFLEQHSRPIDDAGHVDRFEAEELFRSALARVPTHERSAIAILPLLYDQRRYDEMMQIVKPFLDENTGSARLRLASGLAAYRLGMLKDADRLFHDALDRMSPLDRRDMTSLARIIRKPDANAYEALSDTGRMHTDSAFWEGADPLLSTPENEAWLEFMARNAYSDLQWTDGDMRQTGWKSDRGLIVARYGEPPQRASFAPAGNADAADAIGRVITVWRWPTEDMHFVFTGPPAMNVAIFAGNFRSFAEETRDEVPFSLRNVPISANLDTIPLQIARFRGATANDVKLVIAATANPANLYRNVELAEGTLAWSLHMGEPSRLRLLNTDSLALTLPAPKQATHVWQQQVQQGRWRVRVEAVDPSVHTAAGRAQAEVEARLMLPGMLSVSDPLIGAKVNAPDGTITGLDAVAFLPRGDLRMRQKEQFSLYWEMYGLVPDAADNRVKFEVNITIRLLEIDRTGTMHVLQVLGNIGDAIGLTPLGDQQMGVTFSGEELLGSRDRVPRVFSLGLGSAPAGTYRLELTITDKVTKAKTRSDRVFYLARQ